MEWYLPFVSKKLKKGKTYKLKFKEPYVHIKVSDSALAKLTETNIMWVKVKALKDGTLTLYGHKLSTEEDPDAIAMTKARPGAAVEISYEFNDRTFLGARCLAGSGVRAQ